MVSSTATCTNLRSGARLWSEHDQRNQTSPGVMIQSVFSVRFPRAARTILVALACCLGAASPSSAQTAPSNRQPVRPAADPPGALPFDLAFDMREFLWSSTLSISRDG